MAKKVKENRRCERDNFYKYDKATSADYGKFMLFGQSAKASATSASVLNTQPEPT